MNSDKKHKKIEKNISQGDGRNLKTTQYDDDQDLCFALIKTYRQQPHGLLRRDRRVGFHCSSLQGDLFKKFPGGFICSVFISDRSIRNQWREIYSIILNFRLQSNING